MLVLGFQDCWASPMHAGLSLCLQQTLSMPEAVTCIRANAVVSFGFAVPKCFVSKCTSKELPNSVQS